MKSKLALRLLSNAGLAFAIDVDVDEYLQMLPMFTRAQCATE